MIRCQNCSAPLAGFKALCDYCGSANDVDRDLLMRNDGPPRDSKYACPACGAAMKNLELGSGGGEKVTLDQCGSCFGLFFPFYKLEAALDDAARHGLLVDSGRLQDLGGMALAETRVAYRKCPVCAKIMNRVNFGLRSGVITDQCHGHGVWLDAGEFKRLVEWKNSGGMILQDQRRKQLDAERARRQRMEREKIARWNREADNR
ncbi:MAG TPA: zf-TFIIB domain-containing protein [Fibrobacteria bacterium]|nr:zf-TFIIB domain-containing protein [Fibrobacteria bacterium]